MRKTKWSSRVTAAGLIALCVACAPDEATRPAQLSREDDPRTEVLRHWVSEIDSVLLNQNRYWFRTGGDPARELMADRERIMRTIAARSRVVSLEEELEGGSPPPPPSIDGSNYPKIKDNIVKLKTWIVTQPPQGHDAGVWHEGSYSGTLNGGAISGTMARAFKDKFHEIETPYNMSINYEIARDTVKVNSMSSHGGDYWPQSGGGRIAMQSIPKNNRDEYYPPLPEPEEPDDEPCTGELFTCAGGGTPPGGSTGDGSKTHAFPNRTFEVWCYFISYDGGRSWVNSGNCWLV